MTQWEQYIISRYGSLRSYVYSCLSSEAPNTIKTRFDEFYRVMADLVQDGKDRNVASFQIIDCYDIQENTIDDCVLDAVLYSF